MSAWAAFAWGKRPCLAMHVGKRKKGEIGLVLALGRLSSSLGLLLVDLVWASMMGFKMTKMDPQMDLRSDLNGLGLGSKLRSTRGPFLSFFKSILQAQNNTKLVSPIFFLPACMARHGLFPHAKVTQALITFCSLALAPCQSCTARLTAHGLLQQPRAHAQLHQLVRSLP